MPLLPSSNGLVMQADLACMRDLEAQTAGIELLPQAVLDNPRHDSTSAIAIATYQVLDETIRTTSAESESLKVRKSRSTAGRSSVRSVDGRRIGGYLCKASTTSLQSLVPRKNPRHTANAAASSLPLEAELSATYISAYRSYNTADLSKATVAEALQCRQEEEATANTPTSSLYYTSTRRHSSMKKEREPTCTVTATATVTTATVTTVLSTGPVGSGSGTVNPANPGPPHASHAPHATHAPHTPHAIYGANNQTILPAANVANTANAATLIAGPSTTTWGSLGNQESIKYVIDPAQGNAYYKGQFLGQGGFARVYLMTDVSNGNRYACKIIPKNRMHKIHMQKIAREIMIHKELNHVNVVQMHHYFEDSLNVYMLLEACPRKSLMHVLKYRGKVREPEARYYMKQMVNGVAYIHSQRVVHRDLKPGNMFLSDCMIVKIGDFGLATRPDGQRRRVTICGTPNYIAPEVLCKQAYSYEADVWALGCILYALLVGQPPFDTATLNETYARICSNQYRELDDSIVSKNGQDLIKSLLQLNPQLRPSLEKVKEHPYLTKEFVPNTLPHSCRNQTSHSEIIDPTSSSPSSTSTASRGGTLHKRQSLGKTDGSLRRTDQYHSRHRHYNRQQQVQQSEYRHPLEPLDPVDILRSRQIQSPIQSQKGPPKKSKVSSWLVKKLPKLPKFGQRLTSVLCPDGKKLGPISQSVAMHRALAECVSEVSRCAQQNPPTAENVCPLFVTKWIDYSNKYGLGFQLSDRSVGVLFNDNTKISYTHDRRRVEYMTTDDELTRYHRERDVPVPLQEKLDILRHFAQYMDNFLTEGGERKDYRANGKQGKNSKNACVPRMKRWLRTDKAIVMELTVPLLQVNFFVDHTKMVVSQEGSGKGYLITYIDTGRHAYSYWLEDLRLFGCTADLYDRLYYASKVTREFAELDSNMLA